MSSGIYLSRRTKIKFFTYSCGFYTKIDKAQIDQAKEIILRQRRAISSSQTQTLLDKPSNVPISLFVAFISYVHQCSFYKSVTSIVKYGSYNVKW